MLDWVNRAIGWLTGYHTYPGTGWDNPLCPSCGQPAYGDTRCTGWPKKDSFEE